MDREAESEERVLNENQTLQLHIVGPGQIVPPEALAKGSAGVATTKVEITIHTKASLADGSQIEITREGGKPAKVVVTREKDRWAGTSDDLSKIPEKVRPEVERLSALADGPCPISLPRRPDQPRGTYSILAAPAPLPGGLPSTMAVGPGVEKRLKEMQNQIDELKQQIKALQDNAKPKKGAAPERPEEARGGGMIDVRRTVTPAASNLNRIRHTECAGYTATR